MKGKPKPPLLQVTDCRGTAAQLRDHRILPEVAGWGLLPSLHEQRTTSVSDSSRLNFVGLKRRVSNVGNTKYNHKKMFVYVYTYVYITSNFKALYLVLTLSVEVYLSVCMCLPIWCYTSVDTGHDLTWSWPKPSGSSLKDVAKLSMDGTYSAGSWFLWTKQRIPGWY